MIAEIKALLGLLLQGRSEKSWDVVIQESWRDWAGQSDRTTEWWGKGRALSRPIENEEQQQLFLGPLLSRRQGRWTQKAMKRVNCWGEDEACGLMCLVLQESIFSFLQVVNVRLPWFTQAKATFPVHVVRIKLSLYRFPDELVNVLRFFEQNMVSRTLM